MVKSEICLVRTLLLLLLTLLTSLNFGQRFNFRNYSLDDGLGQSQLYYVFQDSRGYLWCATSGGGVSRYDGAGFVNFTKGSATPTLEGTVSSVPGRDKEKVGFFNKKDGLADNIVFFVTEDRKGRLWFGTDKGVTRYDGRLFKTFTRADGLNDDSVWTIFEDKEGKMWFGTYSGGISMYDGKNFTNYTEKDGLCHNRIFSIIQDRDNNFWIATLKGLSKFDGSKFVNYTKKDGLADDNVTYILMDNKGDLWFATKAGVNKYNGKTFSSYTTDDGLADNTVNSILEDHKGHLWFATGGGVSEFDGTVFTNYTSKQGLSHDYVQSICEDREGNLWFATDLGLSRYSGKLFASLSIKDGLPNDTIWSIWQESSGALWLSTEKGLFKYYEKNHRVVPVKGVPESTLIYPFFEDSRGNLWFSAANSVYKYDGSRVTKAVGKEIIGKYDVYSIYEDKYGSMWYGIYEGGVIKHDGKSFVKFTTAEGLPDNNVNAITADKYGNLVFGTDYGMSIYNGKIFKNIMPDGSDNTRYTLSIIPDWEDNLWIGTYGGGVIRFTPSQEPGSGKIETFTSRDGLSDDEVLLLIFDNRGFLYIGTNKGINRLDVKKFYQTGEKSFRHFGKSEGFLGVECQQNSVYKDRQGNLWFGTVRGAIKYNPGEERVNTKEPSTNLTGLKLFHEEADFSAYSEGIDNRSNLPIKLTLPHTRNHLTFEYIGICLSGPEKVRYKVKLEGFEKDWNPESKATSSTYSNLPPGNYTFKVIACNNNNKWNETPAAFAFRITAPTWQKWWFLLLCLLLISLGIFTYIKLRIRNLQRARRALKDEVHERTLELKQEKAKVELINIELEKRVEERTKKLVKAREQLLQAQKMEAIGTMASGVAHDLNNVLTSIVSLPEFMLMKVPENDTISPYLLKMQKAGKRAADIVQDLLTLSRRGVAITEPVNLNGVIDEYLKSPEFEKLKNDHPGIKVNTHLQDDLLPVMGSLVHLNKTVMNLVGNAAEAMPDGGEITISSKNCDITETLHGYQEIKPGEYVCLSVSDSGIGISRENMERIFEPFYTKKYMGMGGSGLGLTVVWNTMKDHKGYIDVQSSDDKGTTFSLYFRRTVAEIIKRKPVEDEIDYQGNGESILVVDDEPEQREIASLILTKLGYLVITTASGREAVAYLKKHKVDLVMLDMIMEPGIDGCETYKKIKEIHPGQKAIIVSGFSVDERVKTAQRIGAGTFVKKPYLIKEIGQIIKKELEK